MKQQEIEKAFEGRWRMKGYILENIDGKAAKEIARDFFEAGLAIGAREYVPVHKLNINMAYPISKDEAMETPPPCRIKEDDILSVDDTFNHWWSLYDKKRGREKCMQKWIKMSATEQFACIKATPAYVASTPDKAYRKDPLTYLNGKCWNDEIIMKNGTDKSTSEEQRSKLADILAP